MVKVCDKCGATMHKISTITSGNAHFETWQCDECNNRLKFCAGLE